MRIPEKLKWLSTGKTLGEGGQGQVCLVTKKHECSDKKYAMKILNNVKSERAKSRFNREIAAIREIVHPAVIRIMDHSLADDDFQFYVMEYFEGARTLNSIIHSQTEANPYYENMRLCLSLFEKILSALQACEQHSTAIVHRDISPNNILALKDGSIRLIDFGICQIEGGETISLTGESFGTRKYAAPECESGNDTDITICSDIYSAAKVIWSAITSRESFAREEPVFQNLSMKEVFPHTPETWPLALIFEKSIRKKPEDRFSGTNEALDLVQELSSFFQRGHSSVEGIMLRCPGCGWKNDRRIPDPTLRYSYNLQRDSEHFTCDFCGLQYVRDFKKIEESNTRQKHLS